MLSLVLRKVTGRIYKVTLVGPKRKEYKFLCENSVGRANISYTCENSVEMDCLL